MKLSQSCGGLSEECSSQKREEVQGRALLPKARPCSMSRRKDSVSEHGEWEEAVGP